MVVIDRKEFIVILLADLMADDLPVDDGRHFVLTLYGGWMYGYFADLDLSAVPFFPVPALAFDCSGFTYYVYGQMGYTLNRIADDQAQNGVAVNFDQLQPGDLILFSNTYSSSDWITHVGIYIGDGKIVHAANSKRGVTVDTITSGYYYSHYAGARRILK